MKQPVPKRSPCSAGRIACLRRARHAGRLEPRDGPRYGHYIVISESLVEPARIGQRASGGAKRGLAPSLTSDRITDKRVATVPVPRFREARRIGRRGTGTGVRADGIPTQSVGTRTSMRITSSSRRSSARRRDVQPCRSSAGPRRCPGSRQPQRGPASRRIRSRGQATGCSRRR